MAVNKRAWKENDKRRWRVFLDPDPKPIYVESVSVEGRATKRNHRTKTLERADERDVVAWIHYFGDIKVEENAASIALREP